MIHKYKQLGLNIVMDVYSGAVHVVDDVMYDMLDYTLEPFMAEAKCPDYIKEGLKDKYSEEELEESYAEICALVNAGQLFTDDCYDEIAKNWNKQSVVKALFDIESDFVKVNIHMGCNAVIVMNAHDIGVVFLYQTIFHSWVIGLPYLPNNFLAFLPDFLQYLKAVHTRHNNIKQNNIYTGAVLFDYFKTFFAACRIDDLIIRFQYFRQNHSVHI